MNEERKLALFIDFENIARGVREAQYKAFEIRLVLERLVEKGKITARATSTPSPSSRATRTSRRWSPSSARTIGTSSGSA